MKKLALFGRGKCLVTGGAGFIGSHLCDRLLDLGYEVICLDNLITGNLKNISHLKQNPRFKFLKIDVTNLSEFKPKLGKSAFPPQAIFHLASPASPNKESPLSYLKFPIETLLVNSCGTYNLLELAKKEGAKFLYASSSEIYGDPKEHPQKETYWGNVNPHGVRSCYDEGKRFGEAIVMAYVRKFNLDSRIVRIFNTFGPRMDKDDGRAVVNFINQAIEGKPLTIYGDGSQTRSFCFVSDLVEGLILSMFKQNSKGKVFNLGNPEEYTILEFAKIIKELTRAKSEIVFKDLPSDDPKHRCPDITRAKTILGWQPKVSLREGLLKTIEYFRKV